MSQRTTIAAVEAVLGNDWDGITNLQPFIDTASTVVDRVVSCAVTKGETLQGNEPELIERWLAAHVYCQSDQPYSSKSTGGASASFQGSTGYGFTGTKYGQMALRLDWSNCLRNIDEMQRVTFHWLGKPPSTQIPYNERD